MPEIASTNSNTIRDSTFSGEPLEKAARAALRSCKALELPHHPVPKRKIDVSEQGIQGRWCVSSVVFNPTPQEGIDPPGDIGQRQLCLMSDAQVPDRRAHGFQRRGTDRWVEATEQCVVPGPLDPSCAMNETRIDAIYVSPRAVERRP